MLFKFAIATQLVTCTFMQGEKLFAHFQTFDNLNVSQTFAFYSNQTARY